MSDKKPAGRPSLLSNPVSQHIILEKEQREHCLKHSKTISEYVRKLINKDMECKK